MEVSGPVTVNWLAPIQRENGASIDVNELGGYELRYREEGASEYTYVQVADPYALDEHLGNLYGRYEFQVAVYDANGLYSRFVPAWVNQTPP